ncbi:MAG: hypothetical protein QOI17_2001 [Gaiellales bacterium]|jgi:hypothetical protein|nr:hypothetical protein [Gaiellales bacterium]
MVAILGLLTLVAPLFVWEAIRSGNSGQIGFITIWVAILGRGLYEVLYRVALSVEMTDDAACRFRAPLRVTSCRASEITEIKANVFGRNYVTVRWGGGSMRIMTPVDGMHDFVSRVKDASPSVALRGV